ncbi:hypothetical protein EV715DRAFT_298002 [Schizophyllum commune]
MRVTKTRTPSNGSHEAQRRADGRLLFALTFPPHPLLASTTSTCFRRRPALDIRGLIIFDMLTARTHRRVTISASSPSPLSSSAVQGGGAARSAAVAPGSLSSSHGLRVLRSHLLTLYPSGKLDEDASTSSLAFSSRSRSISTHL